VIAFVGSVFSPYYAWARRRHGDQGAPAEQHCALNVSLYRRAPGATRVQRLWSMTERGAASLQRSAHQLQIGRSALRWQGGALQIDIDETTAPWPQRLRGRLSLQPHALPARDFALDAAARHLWQPIAPLAQIDVDLTAPGLRWQGEAYLDHNRGTRPLARDFHAWQWTRACAPGADLARIVYDAQILDGSRRALHLEADASGALQALPLPLPTPLPPTAWRLPRQGYALAGAAPTLLAGLESGPFYVRSLLQLADGGLALHESLSLQRFASPWVQAMLPFRMPRWG